MKSRWNGHCRKDSPCTLLRRAIEKYGRGSFTVSVLTQVTTQDDLNNAEKYWIEHFNSLAPNGYNLKTGGAEGVQYSVDARRKMSAAHKTRPPHSELTRKKISATLRGIKHPNRKRPTLSQTHKDNISHALLGKERTLEVRENIKKSWVKRKLEIPKIIKTCVMCNVEFTANGRRRVVCCSKRCGNKLGHMRRTGATST